MCVTVQSEEWKSEQGLGLAWLLLCEAGVGDGAGGRPHRPTSPTVHGQERMGALTILNHCITNIFHYLCANVMLISDLHQARQWFPPWAPSQLASGKYVANYITRIRLGAGENSNINASEILGR